MALSQGQQQLATPGQVSSRPSGLLRRRANVQRRLQQIAPRKPAHDAPGGKNQVGPSTSSFPPPPPSPPPTIPAPTSAGPPYRRPAADACVRNLRHIAVPLPTKQHGVGISAHGHAHTHPMQPWASRPRRQKRLVVRRAILSEQLKQQEEQEPATAASESDAQSSSEALPNPINTGPLLHGFLEAWICIHQAHPGGPAEVYEHSSPMNDAVWAGLQRDHVQPVKLMTVHQRRCVLGIQTSM
eukprot:1159349-Pelagomonas_calceolata.AAC.1